MFILQRSLWAKTTAEHGAGIAEESQTLLSKIKRIFNLISPERLNSELRIYYI